MKVYLFGFYKLFCPYYVQYAWRLMERIWNVLLKLQNFICLDFMGGPTQTIYHVVQNIRWTLLVREYETDCFPKLDLFDLYWLFCLFYLSFSLHCGGWEKYETFAKLYLFGFWGLLLLFIMLCNMQDGHCWCENMKRIVFQNLICLN